jgi:hypothetical protein
MPMYRPVCGHAGNSEPTPAQDLGDKLIDINIKGKKERPVNEVSSSPMIISDKRKPDENDNTTEGEPSQGNAKEPETSPKGFGKPWGLSVVGNGGNTLPTNDPRGTLAPRLEDLAPFCIFGPVEP